MKSFTRLGVATATAALATAAAALPAQAQSQAQVHAQAQSARLAAAANGGLSAAQALATARIDGRLGTLHALQLAVTDAAHLTGSDRSTLSSLISGDISGLTSLRGKVAAETTAAAVRTDETAMVDDYRVYLLVAPKVHLAGAFDIETAAEASLQKAHDDLAAKLAAASGGGTATEKSELADLQAQIKAAQQVSTGKVAGLLAIQPGPDADAIRADLSPLVSAAKSARKALQQARTDARELRAALK